MSYKQAIINKALERIPSEKHTSARAELEEMSEQEIQDWIDKHDAPKEKKKKEEGKE